MAEDSVGAAQVGASVMYANQGPPPAYREKEQTDNFYVETFRCFTKFSFHHK